LLAGQPGSETGEGEGDDGKGVETAEVTETAEPTETAKTK
jgi:hypothetical protein